MSRGPLLIVAICAALALSIAGCGSDSDSSASTATTEASDLSSKPEVTVPDGPPPTELEEKDLIEGTGTEAKPGYELEVQYVGVGYETGEQFDASWDRGEPFTFTLGDREVIPGWDQGMKGMKVGGRRELIVPPELGYGATGAPPAIAPNETLIFVVDLLSAKPK